MNGRAAKARSKLEQAWVELEWRRCAADPAYFFSRYYYVESERDPRGRELFSLFDYQEVLLGLLCDDQDVIALKARQ